MSDIEVEDRLRAALTELTDTTPPANPELPTLVALTDGIRSDRSPTESSTTETLSKPSVATQAPQRAAWLDVKLLAVVACIVIIIAGIFFVDRRLGHDRPSPTAHTTVPAPPGSVIVPNFVGTGWPSVAPTLAITT